MPDTLAEVLEPRWLSQALGRRFPGIAVESVHRGPVVSRVSTNARFRIECRGGLPRGLPAELCVKGYFADCSEAAGASRTAGIPESLFYGRYAAASGVRTLDCYFADVDGASQHGVVITGDVVARGATFLDALSPYTADQVADSLEQYAVLHGRSWGRVPTGEPWLAPRLEATMRARGLPEIRGNFDGPIGAGVPEGVRDPERLLRAVGRLSRLLPDAEPRCLLHGDAHVGNLYLDGAGRPCLVDWQLVQRGPWYVDVGYHLGCTLRPDERRRAEGDLLAHYLDRLGAEGVDPPAVAEARRGLAFGLVYGFYLWAITLKVAPPVTTVMLERLGSAVADHDAIASVEAAATG
ncbi:MAG: phosphotransferase family protein [Acidimicrobiales bacterium]